MGRGSRSQRGAPVHIRRLRLADYLDVVRLLDIAGLHPRVGGRESRPAFSRQLRANRPSYLGAFDDRRLVGVVLGTHDTRKGWINRLAVHPDYRRRGIAARLVRECERHLRRRGIEIFAALIESDNPGSVALLHRLGYEATDIVYARRKLRPDI